MNGHHLEFFPGTEFGGADVLDIVSDGILGIDALHFEGEGEVAREAGELSAGADVGGKRGMSSGATGVAVGLPGMGWYEGDLTTDRGGVGVDPSRERGWGGSRRRSHKSALSMTFACAAFGM